MAEKNTIVKNVAQWKVIYTKKIMQSIDTTYAENSETYLTVTNSLHKLSLNELSALYAMLLTSK